MPVASEAETSTREQVLHLVVSRGPVSASDLATALRLTPPAVRRHLQALEADGQITARRASADPERGRGRPARRYVATTSAHEQLSAAYAELAVHALEHLTVAIGEDAVRDFADARAAEVERRYRGAVEASGADVPARADALAAALTTDGYEATSRRVRGTATYQLCQGHCPVHRVAAVFPALCEAEAAAFSRLLGVHVQRLSTLAGGGHVCTTSIQAAAPPSPTNTIASTNTMTSTNTMPPTGTMPPTNTMATVEGQR